MPVVSCSDTDSLRGLIQTGVKDSCSGFNLTAESVEVALSRLSGLEGGVITSLAGGGVEDDERGDAIVLTRVLD